MSVISMMSAINLPLSPMNLFSTYVTKNYFVSPSFLGDLLRRYTILFQAAHRRIH